MSAILVFSGIFGREGEIINLKIRNLIKTRFFFFFNVFL